MISAELVDLIKKSLPQIDDSIADDIKKRIEQFYGNKTVSGCFESNTSLPLLQGDILNNLDLIDYSVDNERMLLSSNAVIISTSCDVQQGRSKKFVLVAPVIDLTNHINRPEISDQLIKNLVFDKCYIVSNDFKIKLLVDFSLIQPYPIDLLYKKYNDDSNLKKYTLTIFGKYLFITKMLIYIGRYENPNESNRIKGNERIPIINKVRTFFHKNKLR